MESLLTYKFRLTTSCGVSMLILVGVGVDIVSEPGKSSSLVDCMVECAAEVMSCASECGGKARPRPVSGVPPTASTATAQLV
ncbi:hypothetical protein GUJ93_ZPchr0014g46602 [Zizania palustris]|uniref:Uncharacterized protein n=1 Tax=Zizania palustris TaxID=103762 RepID=A0A8J5TKN2_ZIZPA|nr:hypothetical protein GUJ93_ZPchr0014g46602 [Zizania palustris]